MTSCIDLQYNVLFLPDSSVRQSLQKKIKKYWRKYRYPFLELIKTNFPLGRSLIYIVANVSIKMAAIIKMKLIKINDWRIDFENNKTK